MKVRSVASAEYELSLIFLLRNTIAPIDHDDPSLPFDFKAAPRVEKTEVFRKG